MSRPSWPEYFMELTYGVLKRSTCLSRKVGAMAVRDKRILTTGYNGVPSGVAHCADVGCIRLAKNLPSGTRHELCRGLHAEQNVIVQAAYLGVTLKGATLYVTNQPCVICVKMIINAGFAEIIYENPYDDKLAMDMLQEANIKLGVWDSNMKKVYWRRKKKK